MFTFCVDVVIPPAALPLYDDCGTEKPALGTLKGMILRSGCLGIGMILKSGFSIIGLKGPVLKSGFPGIGVGILKSGCLGIGMILKSGCSGIGMILKSGCSGTGVGMLKSGFLG